MVMPHNVLLVKTSVEEPMHYSAHINIKDCMDTLMNIFEKQLKRKYAHLPRVAYNGWMLMDYIDQLPYTCCIMYDSSTNGYIRYNKVWIKMQIFDRFKRLYEEAHGIVDV